MKKADEFKENVSLKLVGFGTRDEKLEAQLTGFFKFIADHPAYPSTKLTDYCKRGDEKMFEYKLNGGTARMGAHAFYANMRGDYHDNTKTYHLHTEDLQTKARALPFWGADPVVELHSIKKTPQEHWEEYKNWWADDPNRKPPCRNSKDAKETSLAQWASNAFPPHERYTSQKRGLKAAVGDDGYAAAMAFYIAHKAKQTGAESAQLVRLHYASTGSLPSRKAQNPREKTLGRFIAAIGNPSKRASMIKSFGGEKFNGETKLNEFLDWLAMAKAKGPSVPIANVPPTDSEESESDEEERGVKRARSE